MSAVGSKNTRPELLVRSALHAAGHRYRLHRRDLPGTPDIVFVSRRIVVRVQGCFWHGHDCRKGKLPATNVKFWTDKIGKNVSRDALNARLLNDLGWEVHDIWECTVEEGVGDLLAHLSVAETAVKPSTAYVAKN